VRDHLETKMCVVLACLCVLLNERDNLQIMKKTHDSKAFGFQFNCVIRGRGMRLKLLLPLITAFCSGQVAISYPV